MSQSPMVMPDVCILIQIRCKAHKSGSADPNTQLGHSEPASLCPLSTKIITIKTFFDLFNFLLLKKKALAKTDL